MVARAFLVLVGLVSACGPSARRMVPVALVVDGDAGAVGALGPHSVTGLELQVVDVPQAPPAPPLAAIPALTEARTAYVRGEFDACRSRLASVDLVALLAAQQRALAARALALETACAWGALATTEAKRTAARFASLGLELPEQMVAPDVEAMLGEATTAAGRSPRHALAVTGVSGARLVVDGRPAGCAVPCTLDLGDGDHVLAVEADGFVAAARLVRVPHDTAIALAQQPASPELAARQWRARKERGEPATDPTGAALIARLARAQRVAVLHGGARVDGALLVDGVVRARAVRDRGDGPALVRELAYDGKILARPSVWQRPWFWIAVTGLTAAVAGATIYYVFEPDPRTVIR